MYLNSNSLMDSALYAYIQRIYHSLTPPYSHQLPKFDLDLYPSIFSFLSTNRRELSQSELQKRSLLVGAGLGLLILCWIIYGCAQKKKKTIYTNFNPTTRRRIHRVLSSFVVPTPIGKSRFPADFLLQRTKNVIELDLALILTGLLSGKLELRGDSMESLVLLMRGTLFVDGYLLKVKVSRKTWFEVASWVTLADYGTAPTTNDSILELDSVPYGSLERTLKSFVLSLPPGSRATIIFTVLAPQIKWLSTDFVLCAVPFMYHSNPGSKQTPTPTPMLLSLKQVVEMLSSRVTSSPKRSLNIISCTNSSVEYSSMLARKEVSSTIEQRMTRLWQAALLNAGWIQKWAVVASM